MAIPSMAGGGNSTPRSDSIRSHDKIVADLEVVSKRLIEDRVRIQGLLQAPGGLTAHAGVFNTITDRIHADTQTQDALLAELFDEMAWHNPELLNQ